MNKARRNFLLGTAAVAGLGAGAYATRSLLMGRARRAENQERELADILAQPEVGWTPAVLSRSRPTP